MNETEEIAKAIQESAKFGQKGLETAQKAASFFAKVFKAPIEEMSGMVTDKLRFVRWKRLVCMSDEVDQILKEKGIIETRSVPPKLALPILEESSLEEDPIIQVLWNHLLANAMNPNFNSDIRYGFIEMIKGITSREAQLLQFFYNALQQKNALRPLSKLYEYSIKKEFITEELSISDDDYAVAANNLMRMQLVGPAIIKSGIAMGKGDRVTAYKGIDAITMTPLGVLFVEACVNQG